MIKSIAKLLGSSVAAQVLSFAALPVISRIYSLAEYGFYGYYLVIISVLSLVATLQLQQATIIPKNKKLAEDVTKTGLLLSILVGCICIAVMIWLEDLLVAFIVGLSIFLSGAGQCYQGYLIRINEFSVISKAIFLKTLGVIFAQLIFGYIGYTSLGLLLGFSFGELIFLLSVCFLSGVGKDIGFSFISARRAIIIVRRYKDVTLYGTMQEVLNTASQGIPVIIFGRYFGGDCAGAYAFCVRVLLAPAQLIANSVRQVSSGRLAAALREGGDVQKMYINLTVMLAAPVLLLTVIFYPYVKAIFEIAFGKEWALSGEYASWLMFWVACLIFNAPSNVIFRIYRQQKKLFNINVLIFSSRLVSLMVCGIFFNDTVGVATYGIVGVFWNILIIFIAWKIVKGKL